MKLLILLLILAAPVWSGAMVEQTPKSQKVYEQESTAVFVQKQSDSKNVVNELKISASDGEVADKFGHAVSVSDTWALIGMNPFEVNPNSGAAYMFKFDGNEWVEAQILTASDGENEDKFGLSLSLFGNRALIGASRDDDGGNSTGSVYVFEFDGTSWVETQKITASDASAGDQFGNSVSLFGDRALIGARGYRESTSVLGAVYVLDYNGQSWVETQKLTASDGVNLDGFGVSVSLFGDKALIGAFEDDENGFSNTGSAYVFEFNGANWTETQKLIASDGDNFDRFGNSVSLMSDRALIGAYFDDTAFGSAYVFDFDGNLWVETQKLTANDAAFDDRFGCSVSILNDRLIIGSYGDDYNGNFSFGSAYLFDFDGTDWSLTEKLTTSDGSPGDELGFAVSLSNRYAFIGGHRADVNNTFESGAVYILEFDEIFTDGFGE